LPPAALVSVDTARGREAVEVTRAAGLGPSARQRFAAERLHADGGADHSAVDIAVADLEPCRNVARTGSSARKACARAHEH
jgi:hypothetical protein